MKNSSAAFAVSVSLSGLLLGLPAHAGLQVNDTLNTYQLYGKDFLKIDGDAETSQGGSVGSDKLVDLTNNNVKINGSLTSGKDINTQANVDVAGFLNARGDLAFFNTSSSVMQWTNVGGKISIGGGDPESNAFNDSMFVGSQPIAVAAWASNTYLGTNISGPVNNGNKAAGMKFGSNKPFPTNNMILPDTVVSFDGSRNCTTGAGVTFNMSMCGLGGNAADTVLPPGKYGDWVIASGNRFYLTSGTYSFKSLFLMSDGTRMIFNQPGDAVSRVLIQGDFTVGSGDNLIAPARYTDAAFKAGTVFLYANGNVQLNDDNKIWATVASPNRNVVVETGLRLFGQIFGKSITVLNGFKGGIGFGRYIPLKKKTGFHYSVIHFQYKD